MSRTLYKKSEKEPRPKEEEEGARLQLQHYLFNNMVKFLFLRRYSWPISSFQQPILLSIAHLRILSLAQLGLRDLMTRVAPILLLTNAPADSKCARIPSAISCSHIRGIFYKFGYERIASVENFIEFTPLTIPDRARLSVSVCNFGNVDVPSRLFSSSLIPTLVDFADAYSKVHIQIF